MNRAPSRPPGRRAHGRRRSMLFTVTPVVATVLIVVAMAAVLVHNLHQPGANPKTAAFGETTTSGQPHAPTPVPTTHTTTPTPTTTPDNPALAEQAVARVDALHVSGVQYGVGVLDRRTGTETLGAEGTVGFYSASVIKLYVVVDLLHRAENGEVTLSSTDQYHIRRMLELSDDNAMNSIWEKYDGAELVTEITKLAGLHDTELAAADPGEWGETKISARDVLAVWQYALTKLTHADTNLVVSDTHSAANDGADGFDQAFGLLEPPRAATVKAKQGWMIAGSEMILNTTGALGSDNQYLVAILTKQSAGIGYPQGRANVNQASKLLQATLAPATS